MQCDMPWLMVLEVSDYVMRVKQKQPLLKFTTLHEDKGRSLEDSDLNVSAREDGRFGRGAVDAKNGTPGIKQRRRSAATTISHLQSSGELPLWTT